MFPKFVGSIAVAASVNGAIRLISTTDRSRRPGPSVTALITLAKRSSVAASPARSARCSTSAP